MVWCLVFPNGRTTLSINTTRNQTLITIDPQTHLDYGLGTR